MSDQQYFEEDPDAPSDPVDVDILLPDVTFSLTTDRGVFARGGLDTGTRILLAAQLPLPSEGTLLDLGCGAGVIALTMALRAPRTTVWAVDVNRRARDLTLANATRAGTSAVRVAAPDDVPDGVVFDVIWSNPPIRIGKIALHALLDRWLARLTPGGRAVLVVQKHLGADSLTAWLRNRGWSVERLASKAGYRLLQVTQAEQDTSAAGASPEMR